MSGSTGKRRQSRRVLLQALYKWDLAGSSEQEIIGFFSAEGSLRSADKEYFKECLHGVLTDAERLDNAYEPYLDRTVAELNPVERACLRAGSFELIERGDVPQNVVINEWIELSKTFGAQNSYRYVNAVLDAVAQSSRGQND